MEINCVQFSELITFYLNDELSKNLKQAFEEHLKECPNCNLRFKMLHSLVDELRHVYNEISIEHDETENDVLQSLSNEEIDEDRNLELSAYIDNELNEEFSVKVRKAIVAKPQIRNKIKKLYKIQKCLKNSYLNDQNHLKKDYSGFVLKKLNICSNDSKSNFYCVLFITFVVILVLLSLLVIVHLI